MFAKRIALLCALLLATGGAASPADAPLEINAILSLTGQNAYLSGQELVVFRTVEDLVNKSGGVRGRSIKFVVADDQTNPQLAVQLANQIFAKKAPVLLGLGIGATCKAVAPLVEKDGPVTFCFTPAVNPAPGSYLFSSTAKTFDTISVGMRYFRLRGWTRVALMTTNDATGQDVQENFAEALALPENKAVRLVDSEHFNVADISVAAQVAKIKAANPQAIFVSSTGTPFGTVLHGLKDSGLDVPVWTGASNMTRDQMIQYGAFLPKMLIFSSMIGMLPGVGPRGRVRDAEDVYFTALRERNLVPTTGQNLSWDATMLVVDAYRHLGFDATAAQIRDYIEGLRDWAGINGFYDFRAQPQRGIAQGGMIVLQWDAAQRAFVRISGIGGGLK